jgi:acetoin utilization deacetylase AcuC-like enzyme
MESFRPELVIVSAGFDCLAGDPLAGLALTDAGIAAMTARAVAIARRWASGRLVSLLEGGYNLRTLGPAAAAHVGALHHL